MAAPPWRLWILRLTVPLLACALPPLPDCGAVNRGYEDPDVPEVNGGLFLPNAVACQEKCALSESCERYTFYNNSGGCWLQGSHSSTRDIPGVISGPPDCAAAAAGGGYAFWGSFLGLLALLGILLLLLACCATLAAPRKSKTRKATLESEEGEEDEEVYQKDTFVGAAPAAVDTQKRQCQQSPPPPAAQNWMTQQRVVAAPPRPVVRMAPVAAAPRMCAGPPVPSGQCVIMEPIAGQPAPANQTFNYGLTPASSHYTAYNLFDLMDANHDGVIDRSEFGSFLANPP